MMHYWFFIFCDFGDHLFNSNELPVTETELAAIANPASAGYSKPIPATGMSIVLYANA